MYTKETLILLIFSVLLAGCSDMANSDASSSYDRYKEPHRPQLHFSPDSMWMNDPNGMVFFEGEYHLFYQYYPDSTVWGPMHWGHAVSSDLVHWEHLPIALYPDEKGYIFSGSAVVDWENTSGFSETGEPPLVAIFTYHDPKGEKTGSETFQSQAIAYSNDKGRTWTKYDKNPVISNPGIRDFRDPKVIWDSDSRQWVMVFAVQDHVRFYGSKDLKSWYYLNQFGKNRGAHGGVWECPDLFPMTIDETGAKKWVLLVSINPGSYNGGSGTQYFVGEFNGRNFRLDQEFGAYMAKQSTPEEPAAAWLDFGRDNYAGVTWSDIPDDDGRRIFLGWMSNWDYAQVVPTQRWRSAMTLPRVLQLIRTPKGPRLSQQFPVELEALRADKIAESASADNEGSQLEGVSPQQLEIVLEAAAGDSGTIGFELKNDQGDVYRIGYDAEKKAYFSDRTKAGKNEFSDKFAPKVHYAPKQIPGVLIDMHIILDVSSAELIADDGLTAITDRFFPQEDFTSIRLFKDDASFDIQTLDIYTLKGIW